MHGLCVILYLLFVRIADVADVADVTLLSGRNFPFYVFTLPIPKTHHSNYECDWILHQFACVRRDIQSAM